MYFYLATIDISFNQSDYLFDEDIGMAQIFLVLSERSLTNFTIKVKVNDTKSAKSESYMYFYTFLRMCA